MKKFFILPILLVLALVLYGCYFFPSSDQMQRSQQEEILKEGNASVGMPAINNFREKRMLKKILELRDQEGLTTYTYIVAEQTGKLIFLGESVGYGLPAAAQYSNPQKVEGVTSSYVAVAQADPNGLFSPSSAEGTWVMMKNPKDGTASPIYIEPRVIISPFKLE